jgi:mannose-6-phosphate isomerase-like protein (cupin superfamily)
VVALRGSVHAGTTRCGPAAQVSALRPSILHFTRTLSLEEEAERRVLMLISPGMQDPPATVNRVSVEIQVILPGETPQAHRHTVHAFRLVVEGDAAYTTVDGERLPMNPGDLLLTPGRHRHDHRRERNEPMMWLDGLDFPLANGCEASFFEPFGDRAQKSLVPDDLSSRRLIHSRVNPAREISADLSSPLGNYAVPGDVAGHRGHRRRRRGQRLGSETCWSTAPLRIGAPCPAPATRVEAGAQSADPAVPRGEHRTAGPRVGDVGGMAGLMRDRLLGLRSHTDYSEVEWLHEPL